MTASEILEQKETLNVNDISLLLGISKNLAYQKIREIRSVSDILGISGRCHKKDYFKYIDRLDKEGL